MTSANEIATWLKLMRQRRGLRDPRNPIAAAPESLRNIVGANEAPMTEFITGLEFALSQFICGGDLNGEVDEDALLDADRLLLALSMNFWPCVKPQGLDLVPDRAQARPVSELEWMQRAGRLVDSKLIDGCTSVRQANRLSEKALAAFTEHLLRQRESAAMKDYFSRSSRALQHGDQLLQVFEVGPHVPGTPAISWQDFGRGIDRLTSQIREHDVDIDLAVGVNEAGLTMAALLAPVRNARPALGYLRTRGVGPGRHETVDEHSMLPGASAKADSVLLCDFEVKSGNSVFVAANHVRQHLSGSPRIYFAVMGALAVEAGSLPSSGGPLSLETLACYASLEQANVEGVFIAAIMMGSIDPPNRSR